MNRDSWIVNRDSWIVNLNVESQSDSESYVSFDSRFTIYDPMRLDLFLKASRLCPRRTVAQKLCEAGLVSLNGVPAKPAHPIRAGDEIVINRRDRVSVIKVLAIPSQRQTSKKDAATLFALISEQKLDDLAR